MHSARKCKLEEIRDNPEHEDGIGEDIRHRIAKLNDHLMKVRQESINILKGRLTNQITSFKKTIHEVLNKDISLAEKIWTQFREQGTTIASILTATGMVIGILVVVELMAQQVSLHLRMKKV